MNKIGISHIVGGIVIIGIQILILKNMQVVVYDRFVVSAFLYPLILIVLPFTVPRSMLLTIAFFLGLLIDVAYDSPGLHAAALVLTAFLRAFVLKVLEPRGSYSDKTLNIANYGFTWFMTYLVVMLGIHIFAYFSLDAFTFIFLGKIIVNTLLGLGISLVLSMLYSFILRY